MSFKEWLMTSNRWGWFALAIMVAYVAILLILGIEILAALETAAQKGALDQ